MSRQPFVIMTLATLRPFLLEMKARPFMGLLALLLFGPFQLVGALLFDFFFIPIQLVILLVGDPNRD